MKLFHRKPEPVRLQKVQPNWWNRINYFCIQNAGIILFLLTLLVLILTVIATCMIVGANGGCLESGNYYNHLKNI